MELTTLYDLRWPSNGPGKWPCLRLFEHPSSPHERAVIGGAGVAVLAHAWPVAPRATGHAKAPRSEQLVGADDGHVLHSGRLRVPLLEVFEHLRVLGIP